MIHPVQNIKTDDHLTCHRHIAESADGRVPLEDFSKPPVRVIAEAPLNSVQENIQLL